VVKDARNTGRIKVICRDEAEILLVRETAQKDCSQGSKGVQDQLYPVKVDGANHTEALDSPGNVLPRAADTPGKENDVTIAKIQWISDGDNGQDVRIIGDLRDERKQREATPRGEILSPDRELASTNVFERRQGPVQC
jgi:hypothetical protein